MQRRTFIQHAVLASSGALLPSCRKGGAREAVLRNLVEHVLVPNTVALARDSVRLEHEVSRLGVEPTLATLRTARTHWQQALLSWKRADVFRIGPIVESNAVLRAMFWPVRSAAIEALVLGSQSLDDASIDAMGVDRRGLFALEYLLYGKAPEQESVAEFAGPTGERRARLASALAANVSLNAKQVEHALGNGHEFAEQFANSGQDSLNHVVGRMIDTVENVSAKRLTRIATLAKSDRLQASEVEGSLSGTSQQIVLSYLRATEQLYRGADDGLARLVKARSSTTDDAIRSAFAQAIGLVSNLAAPLEVVARRDLAALEAAIGAVKNLERALRTELVSSLGVSMTFS